ncbi:putative RNA-directed DNA polymerase from transposon X-element [Araneus ventricosus]|uniref:Putative RNA-directed DNA polymerase from transposon X-element n=1 Tax=Araneus ventricosus TaxID=182803 RepID=A0A4Y2J2W9_ARAVE|nr:putative RNA-directed DNA polymerase from transposon X-element [Araneus ventricosus]
MVQYPDLNVVIDNVTASILRAADETIPKSSIKFPRLRKPWWNRQCTETGKNQQIAWNKFRRHPTVANLIAFQRAKSIARRQAQRESWIKLISNINSSISVTDMWNLVKKACGIYPDYPLSYLRKDGQDIHDSKEMADVLAEAFASVCEAQNYAEPFLSYKNRAERIPLRFRTKKNLAYNADFTIGELRRALSTTKQTSPGPDGITYSMISHLSDDSLANVLYMFNRIWREHVFPAKWKYATVIPVPKPGKDPQNPLNYRPIALTSCMCKLLEKIVNARLTYILEKNGLISPFQSGFRKGRCTVDNLILLEGAIRTAFLRRHHLVSIFFDIEKAYDRAWRYGILKDLFDLDFRGNLPTFIQEFLKQRYFRVRLGNTYSDVYCQEEGVPQGSVLSVTLFILKINSILSVLPSSIQKSLYVDDLQISCSGRDMRFVERQLQTAVNNMVTWSNRNGFTFSTQKTFGVHFCRRLLHPDPELFIQDTPLTLKDECKFLGVVFDRRLTFVPHIAYLR